MKVLQTIEKFLSSIVNGSMVLLFTVMLTLAVVQVFLRYFFNGSLLWGDVAARHLVIWVGFLGAAMATRENKHFQIEILNRFIKPGMQRWLQSFSNLFASGVCYFLAQASTTFVLSDTESKTFLEIPATYVEIIIPVSFYIMMVQFALRTIGNIMGRTEHVSTTIQTEA